MDILSNRLRDLRIKKELKQSDIADALCLGRSSASNYENGRDVPPEVIVKYAQYFNVSADYLLGLSPSPLPQNVEVAAPFAALAAADASAFTLADVLALVSAFTAYHKAGAPAGDAPMICFRAVIDALRPVLAAASRQDTPQLLLAVNRLAACCLQANDILKTYLLKEEPT